MRGYSAALPLFAALSLTAAVAAPLPALAQSPPTSSAQSGLAMAQPIERTVPDPVDTAYPGGTIRLDIDATDTQRGVYRVTQTFPLISSPPAAGGLPAGMRRMTLLFPQWLPGNHGPRGPLAELVDIRFSADGQPVRWTRDPVEVFAFHVDFPAAARELTAKFIHTSPLQSSEGRVTMTPDMLNLQWEKMSLYPAGHYVRRVRIAPTVTLPQGWTAASALDGMRADAGKVSWAETDYETLVDSPIFAGKNYRAWDLGNTIKLNVVADEADLLDLAPENAAKLRALSTEALALFGRAPFDRYEFLVALSSRLGGIGLEHLRSSENQLEPRAFVDWKAMDWDRNVLPHELVHAWNGKYRRPAKLWTPDYRQPMQDNLLWLYEGQTQFWGYVLAARSGVQTRDTVLAMFATQAGNYSEQPGRSWRSIEDTTLDPVFGARKPKPYASLARSEDYYNEGALVWLEADQIIRSGTGGKRGLDDFAQAFFAHRGDRNSLEGRALTYEFDDIVRTLNSVHRYDWANFLQQRMQSAGQPAPLAGIERAGYRLVWRDEPNSYDKARMDDGRTLNLTHSLGLTVDRDGAVSGVRWDGPAFKAGVASGTKIVAVNDVAFDMDKLKKAITEAKGGNRPITLLTRRGDRFATAQVTYNGGLRWPWLERAGGPKATAPLDKLLAPKGGRK